MQPKVTVLMSCYNAARWLEEAVNSVLTQTFKDFEFLIIDDGSTDETLAIIQRLSAMDRRVVVIAKPNTGLVDSLNTGIFQAQGQWIARLDADDLCEQTRLEQQLNYVRDHPQVVLLGSGFFEIDENGHVIKTQRYPVKHNPLKKHLERCQRFFPHSSAFYQTATARQLGGYRPRIRRAEDWDFWLRLSKNGQLACLLEPLVRIRKHGSQISHDESGRRQKIDARVGVISHFLRQLGDVDPVAITDEAEWTRFFAWVEKRIDEEGIIESRQTWEIARTRFFDHQNRLLGGWAFISHLMRSGYAGVLIKEKFMGSDLPERLAKEWINYSKEVQKSMDS